MLRIKLDLGFCDVKREAIYRESPEEPAYEEEHPHWHKLRLGKNLDVFIQDCEWELFLKKMRLQEKKG